MVIRKKSIIDAFSKVDVTLYYKEDDKLSPELVGPIHDVVQWAKANREGNHGWRTYETLCTAVGDWRGKEDCGRVIWLKNRPGIGTKAMKSGNDRKEVLEESMFLDGDVFNDESSDFKTRNRGGRLVFLMGADVDQRKAYFDDKPKNRTYLCGFRLAQIAKLPKQHATRRGVIKGVEE